jgi:hypothetical protein
VLSDAEEAALSAVEDIETLLEGAAATTCSPVSEALAATPGVIAWLIAAVAEDSTSNAVVVLVIGDADSGFEDDKEDEVVIDKLVALLLVDINVDMVVGIGVMFSEELIAEVTIDDRDKLDVVEEVV